MKLVELRLTNYRAYKNETIVTFDDLTILIGKNDAGKSSVMDALDVFFNDAQPDKDDVCVSGDASRVRIACVFEDLPERLVLDEQYPTSLAAEHLLRRDGRLQICKTFNMTGAKAKTTTTALAFHPTAEEYKDLLDLKNRELKDRAKKLGVDLSGANPTVNAQLRSAIWQHASNLEAGEREVDLSSETGKAVWQQLESVLPTFALFKSDRPSTDQDEEAQDPMKAAVKEAIKAHEHELSSVVAHVKTELEEVVKKTVQKIQEMSPDLAREMSPQVRNKNWDSLFSVSLMGDEGVPINKRGSGTRRLVLLNFFRAKAEDASDHRHCGLIYAIEEPETSQHPNQQMLLLDAFQTLVATGDCQIILTTHTPTLARRVDRNSLRLIDRKCGSPVVLHGSDDSTLKEIKQTLGVLPDHDIKAFLGVEGKWDIEFLRRLSHTLAKADPAIPDLSEEESKGSLVFVPLGGSSMDLWTHRLENLDRREFYITDRDNRPPQLPKYDDCICKWNERQDCKAWCTSKKELENYLHPRVVKTIAPNFPDKVGDFDSVPELAARAIHEGSESTIPWDDLEKKEIEQKKSRVKARLNRQCADLMTVEDLADTDPDGDLRNWLEQIGKALGLPA